MPSRGPAKQHRQGLPQEASRSIAALTKYIFPGGELDYIGNTVANLERHGFEVHDVEGWREHYQRTCRHWHDRLLPNYDAAVAEVGEVKTRLWLAYLGGVRSRSSATRSACTRRWRQSAGAGRPACHRRGPISIPEGASSIRSYSITSLARSKNNSGMVNPSAFAVVLLTTRSNLSGCSTGMSAGFAPRRILST